MAKKRLRRNKSKKRTAERRRRLARGAKMTAIALAAAGALTLLSAVFIFIYAVLTQSDFFPLERMTIEGAQRLSQKEIIDRAGIHKGANILAVNLTAVRKKLISHPWIADAQVRREVPAGLWIRIREHQCAAVVDLGDKFLLNRKGQLFKQWQPKSDPDHLPLIKGLAAADLTAAGMPGSKRPYSWPGAAEAASDPNAGVTGPLAAVMQILHLGERGGSTVPNRQIDLIKVDRKMGLTLHAFKRVKVINLGYDDYPRKYRMLATMLVRARRNRLVPDFTHIDLQDISRIVIKPAKQEP